MDKKKKIPIKEYNEIVSGLELNEIYLKESSSRIDDAIKEKPQSLKISLKDKCTFSEEGKGVINIVQKYHLEATSPKTKKTCIDITTTYVVRLKSKQPFTKPFFAVYHKTSLPLNTWPYLREFINSITSKMNVPPLTLPFFKKQT